VAYLALALYLASAAASVARLGARDAASAVSARLDEAQYRFAATAYFFHTALILTGAWYSLDLFGTFWKWDPVEGLAALSWLAYGLALHARLFFRWRGRRLAVALLLSLVTVLALYKVVPYLGPLTFHVFDLRFGGPPR
jgi:ABC-type transport system involved in cytochrome c biogenesis permease subunit